MLNLGPTFIWVAVNLLALYFILKRILFKPVTEFMDNRAKSIRDSLENAERTKAEAYELRRMYAEQLGSAKQEADRILNEARSRGGREYDAIIEAAKHEAERILEKAREEIERERKLMLKEVKNQLATLALAAASKVLEANMDTESNRALVNKFIDEAGAA